MPGLLAAMRTWLTLWLCACLLLASPVQGSCCLQGASGHGQAAAAVDDADLPPCHRASDPVVGTAGDEAGTQPAPAATPDDCKHCACPCRIAALPMPQPADGVTAPPVFPSLRLLAGVTEHSRIPPLPPPIG